MERRIRFRTAIVIASVAVLGAAVGGGAWALHQRQLRKQAEQQAQVAKAKRDELLARVQRGEECAKTARRVMDEIPLSDFWPRSEDLWRVKQITVAGELKLSPAELRDQLTAGLAEIVACAQSGEGPARRLWEEAGDVAFALLRLPDAERYYRQAEGMLNAGEEYGESLRLQDKIADLLHVAGHPDVERSTRELVATLRANSHNPDPAPLAAATRLALCYRDLGRHPEAISLLENAMKSEPESFDAAHPDRFVALGVHSFLLRELNKWGLCEEEARRLVLESERVYGADSPQVAIATVRLSAQLLTVSKLAAAQTVATRAVGLCEKNFGPEHPLTSLVLHTITHVEYDRGRYAEAEEIAKRILEMDEKNLPQDHPSIGGDLMQLGAIAVRLNRLADGQRLLRGALECLQNSLGPDAPQTAQCRAHLANVEAQLGNLGGAEAILRQSVADQPTTGFRSSTVRGQALESLGLSLVSNGRLREAEEDLREAVSLLEKEQQSNSPDMATAYRNLATCLEAENQLPEAESLLVRSQSILESKFGPNHPELVVTLDRLGRVLVREGRMAEAERILKRAIGVGVTNEAGPNLAVTNAMGSYGLFLQAAKRYPEALAIQRKIEASVAISAGTESESYGAVLNNLAGTLAALGRNDEAEHAYSQAMTVADKLPPDTVSVATWSNNFAVLRVQSHQEAAAEPLYRRAVGIAYRASARAGGEIPNFQTFIEAYTRYLQKAGLNEDQINDRLDKLKRGEEVPNL